MANYGRKIPTDEKVQELIDKAEALLNEGKGNEAVEFYCNNYMVTIRRWMDPSKRIGKLRRRLGEVRL